MRRRRLFRRTILSMVGREQSAPAARRHMSGVLWDLFTGSAPYREVLRNALHPGCLVGVLGHGARSLATRSPRTPAGS
jgi:hypothetical protein